MSDSVHVACPRCAGVNRVPRSRLDAGPRCGKCREPLFDGRPVALTEATFDAHVGRGDLPVLVDFWAPWCGPCRMMAPAFEEAAARLEPRVRLAKVNTEEEPGLAGRHGIRSIPTLVLFRGGREVARQPGATDLGGIVSWTSGHLGL